MAFHQFIESDAKPSPLEPNKVFLQPPEDEVQPVQKEDQSFTVYDYSYPDRKFTEPPIEFYDDREYKRTGTDPGLVVIFNQQIFDDVEYRVRHGTNRDVNELIITFGRLGYNVEKENIHNNLKRDEILEKIKILSQMDHCSRNSLVIIVLTHGDENNILRAKNREIYTHEIWGPFSEKNCPSLRNKPKFFIFQACKGQNYSESKAVQSDVVPNIVYDKPMEPNMLLAFAAVEGNQSYRHVTKGSWFIQELCKTFSVYGRRDDVVSLLIRTAKCVAHNYYYYTDEDVSCNKEGSETAISIEKQMPLFISTLTKNYYLNKNKDRGTILHLQKQQMEVLKKLQNIVEADARKKEEMKKQRWRRN